MGKEGRFRFTVTLSKLKVKGLKGLHPYQLTTLAYKARDSDSTRALGRLEDDFETPDPMAIKIQEYLLMGFRPLSELSLRLKARVFNHPR